MKISFFVAGIPRPGGSKRVFPNPKTGGFIVTDDSRRNKDWRAAVSQCASDHFRGPNLLRGPLFVSMIFYMPRPKNHYGTGKNAEKLKAGAPEFHTSKPDRLKLARSTEDALNGVIWKDDSQIATGPIEKRYTEGVAGAQITIEEL